jgi:hypothetical protein
LAAICTKAECPAYIRRQLVYINSYIVFTITSKAITLLERNPSYDLRKLLGGTRASLKSIIHMANTTPSLMMEAVPTVKMPVATRSEVTKILSTAKGSNILYCVLLMKNQLVAYSQTKAKGLSLQSSDLLLIINFINSSPSLRANDSWTPMCLPAFNSGGFLHAFISFMSGEKDLCLLLISR